MGGYNSLASLDIGVVCGRSNGNSGQRGDEDGLEEHFERMKCVDSGGYM